MANSVIVNPGQTLADLAMQELGSIEAIFALAQLNNRSVSDALSVGDQLSTDITPFSTQVQQKYLNNGFKPASDASIPGQGVPDQPQGIGYWFVNYDFIIS